MKGQKEFDGYIMHCKANNLAENTIELYQNAITSLLTYIDKVPKNITIEDLDKWKRYLMITPIIYKNYKNFF